MKDKTEKVVDKLLETITEAKLNQSQLIKLIYILLFSIGATLEGCTECSSKEVLMNYAKNPTLGNALMAQSLQIKESWGRERNPKDES